MKEKREDKRETLFGKIMGLIFTIIFWLLLSLFFSILVELLGMSFFWEEQGVNHSKSMYEKELSYLQTGLREQYVSEDQISFISDSFKKYNEVSEYVGLNKISIWFEENASSVFNALNRSKDTLGDYLTAAAYMTKVFIIRLSILCLSWSAFLVAFLVGAADGLVERDRRTWGGGRESATIYLLGRYSIKPLLIGSWVIYLSLPFSLHPSLIILPFVLSFGFAVRTTCSKMKKYF